MKLLDYEKYVTQNNFTRKEEDLINQFHLIMGLNSEVGEVSAHFQKSLRKNKNLKLNKRAILLELGDVLWYLTALTESFDSSLTEIMDLNYQKLEKRYNEVI